MVLPARVRGRIRQGPGREKKGKKETGFVAELNKPIRKQTYFTWLRPPLPDAVHSAETIDMDVSSELLDMAPPVSSPHWSLSSIAAKNPPVT